MEDGSSCERKDKMLGCHVCRLSLVSNFLSPHGTRGRTVEHDPGTLSGSDVSIAAFNACSCSSSSSSSALQHLLPRKDVVIDISPALHPRRLTARSDTCKNTYLLPNGQAAGEYDPIFFTAVVDYTQPHPHPQQQA